MFELSIRSNPVGSPELCNQRLWRLGRECFGCCQLSMCLCERQSYNAMRVSERNSDIDEAIKHFEFRKLKFKF
jgi:hypothetical protein